ncbi:MAG: hypothetical protein QOF61_2507, partial [Acidobacteriota bacterium]|nr:hypothetical protein [Acidobacteriota bacterium]
MTRRSHVRTPALSASARLVSILLCYAVISASTLVAPRATTTSTSSNSSSSRRGAAAAPQGEASRWRADELLVRFRPDSPEQSVNFLLSSQGLRRGSVLRGSSRVERLRLSAGQDPQLISVLLASSPLVEFAEPNYLIKADQVAPNDPRFSEQWALFNQSTPGGDIGVARAWPTTRGTTRTVVAVVDSGIDFAHPDLRRNQWVNAKEPSATTDADGNGYAGDRRGWDWVTNSPAVKDESGHGTAVAGIIAAEGNNGVGTTGVMWRASLMSLRVLDSTNTGDVAGAVEAIDYAAANGAQIVNISWGTGDASAALKDAIARAARRDVLFVCSAGNSGQDIDAASHYPASFDLPNLVSVAATDGSDTLTSFSNWGATRASVAAPGVNILTTKAGGGYDTVSGTSAAAPLVTGVAGLFRSLNAPLTVTQLKTALVSGARPVTALAGRVSAGGVVNASLALEALRTLLENSRDGGRGNANGANPNASGGGIGNGNAQRNSVRPSAPSRTPATPGLPNLNDIRTRKHELPRTPDAVPSLRFSPGDGPRGRRASLITPGTPQSGTLARLTNFSLAELAASLGARGVAVSIPSSDYYDARATSDAPSAGLSLSSSSSLPLQVNDAAPPRIGTEVSYAHALSRLFAVQSQAYDASFSGQSVPTTMVGGQPYNVSVTMTNTGSNTWTASELYRLGEVDTGAWGVGRVHLTAPVPYGASATFNFTIVAPTTPGTYNFQWQMVRDAVTWFGASSTSVNVTVTASGGGGSLPARMNPVNRVGSPGEDLLSRNFNWSVALLSLKGRSGLDLGLALSYNSLVWTKDGSTMVFDADRGDPTPGFRLGFPVIQPQIFDAQVGRWAYLLILPSGRRVELLRIGTSNSYESTDSSYLSLVDNGGGSLSLWTPDGTRLQYAAQGVVYRCTEIKDRNGNYISIYYNTVGNIQTIVDTLGRSVVFGYDAYNKPTTISQFWWREYLIGNMTQTVQELHTWATFGYSDLTLQTNYPGLSLSGAQNGQTIPVLTQVGLTDGTRFNFDYTSYAQVYRVTRSTMDTDYVWRARSYVQYNLPLNQSYGAQTDCPRFTERRDWAAYWNGDADSLPASGEESVTTFSQWDAGGASGQVTTPDGTTYKEFYGTTGQQRGLMTRAEFWSGGVLRKWTTT